ncbi:MAG TPA: hypothetical protein VMB46_08805 [Methanomassiliicoccales archaeon]|nr:hypothetical protein [Methanomassiliicoccales archaeon]
MSLQAFANEPRLSFAVPMERAKSCVEAPFVKITGVRDYRDRYILRALQEEAKGADPGFPLLEPSKQKAKIVWVDSTELLEPAGYYIYEDGHPHRHFSALGVVWYPTTFHQVYVRPEMRHHGIATIMFEDFISHTKDETICIESPKSESRSLLRKLGYEETERSYQMWEMLEGLSFWEPLGKKDELTVNAARKERHGYYVWSVEERIGLSEYR